MTSETPPKSATSSHIHYGRLFPTERDIAQVNYVVVRATLQTPSPHGCRALDISPKEVVDLVQSPEPLPCCLMFF